MRDILQVGKQICTFVEPLVPQDCLDPTTQRVALLAASGTLAFGYLCGRYAAHRFQHRSIQDSTVLATAAEGGNLTLVRRCIAGKSHDGYNPLHKAARSGNVGVLRELLRAEYDASAADTDGNTPLHLACLSGHSDCVKALLPHSKRVLNKANNDDLTPVMLAAKEGKALCVHLLVNARGINLRVETTNEKTLLDLAAKSGSSATLGVLMEKYSKNSALFPDDPFSTSSFVHAFKREFREGVRAFLPHVASWPKLHLPIADAIQSKRHTLLPCVLWKAELTDLTTSVLGKPIPQMIGESSLPNKAKLLRIIRERLAVGGAGAGAGAGAARV